MSWPASCGVLLLGHRPTAKATMEQYRPPASRASITMVGIERLGHSASYPPSAVNPIDLPAAVNGTTSLVSLPVPQ